MFHVIQNEPSKCNSSITSSWSNSAMRLTISGRRSWSLLILTDSPYSLPLLSKSPQEVDDEVDMSDDDSGRFSWLGPSSTITGSPVKVLIGSLFCSAFSSWWWWWWWWWWCPYSFMLISVCWGTVQWVLIPLRIFKCSRKEVLTSFSLAKRLIGGNGMENWREILRQKNIISENKKMSGAIKPYHVFWWITCVDRALSKVRAIFKVQKDKFENGRSTWFTEDLTFWWFVLGMMLMAFIPAPDWFFISAHDCTGQAEVVV